MKFNCSLAEYHARKEPSPSILARAFNGIPDLVCYMEDRETIDPTPEMNLGTFIHDWIENKGVIPEWWSKSYETYKVARKDKGVEAGDYKRDRNGEILFSWVNTNDESLSLTSDASKRADKIIDVLEQSQIIKTLFGHNLEIEPSYIMSHDGHNIRIRPDIVDHTTKTVWEIKTAAQWQEFNFSKQTFNMSYDLQAFCELYGVRQTEGDEFKKLNFLVIGIGRPASIWVYTIEDTDDHMLVGQYKLSDALQNWNEFKKGNCKSFHEGFSELALSYSGIDYKMKKEMV